jgi:TetR/AcrR family transcriptional regulator, regulator of mycofactocin system
LSVREDKKRETRARLERAALDLFARRGYDRTTVQDVAGEAGVSARTAFRYFPAKSDLVFGDSEADLEELRRLLARKDHATSAFEAVRSALTEFSERIDTPMNAERSRLIAANPVLTARSLAIRERWAEAIATELAARRGGGAPDGREWLGGQLIVAVLLSAVREWSRDAGTQEGLGAAVDRSARWATEIVQR